MHLIRVGDRNPAEAKRTATRRGATKVSWLTDGGCFRTWEKRGKRWHEVES